MQPIVDFDDPTFNPFLADEIVYGDHLDPYPKIAELRRAGRVQEKDYRVEMGLLPDVTLEPSRHFMVLGYDEVNHILQNPAIFSNAGYRTNLGVAFGRTLSVMEPPEHPVIRKIFQKAFLPQMVKYWGESVVQPVIDDLVSKFQGRGTADLIQEFTFHYPFNVIYRQLALPPEDVKIFHKLAMAQTLIMGDAGHATEASDNLGVYFKAMIADRRKNPGDDLVSTLIHAEVEGEYLPDEMLISFFRQLVNAAGDTTYRATSVLLTCLLNDPPQLEMVRNDRSLVPFAIEEALRWDPPTLIIARAVAQDTVLAGVELPAGSYLDVLIGSANRDEARFPDPDRFDIMRDRKVRHLAFAGGPHICIGQHLARIEMTNALNAVLDRLPNIRLDPDMPAPAIRGAMLRSPRHLYVRFD